jgi:hypothetical protein
MLLQPDGKILYGGNLRLHPDGSEDTTYFTGSGLRDGEAAAMALLPDGDIILGGTFLSMNGFPYPYLVRLHGGAGQTGTNCRLALRPNLAQGHILLDLFGQAGASYSIETSINLVHWTPLETVTCTTGQIQIILTLNPDDGHRFYRVRSIDGSP